ncbi:MAG: MarR family winged helix-turn-helix transcriptional regulator [Acidimicrobiia bacterium]
MDYESQYLSEPGAVGLFTRLTRVGLLVDAFQHRCLDPFGLRFIDYSVLRVLQLSGEPYRMSPTELAEIVLRSSGGMTQILDRLETAGLVGRTADPSDRRKIVVGLTPDGLRTAKDANASYGRERERILSELSDNEVDDLDRAVHRLLEVLSDDARTRARA